MCGGSPGARAPRRLRKPCNSSVVSSPPKPRLHGFLGKTASPRLGLTISQEATKAGHQVSLVVLERGNAAAQRFWTGDRGGRTRRQQSLEIGKGERSLCPEPRLSVPMRRRRRLLRSSPHLRVICAWNAGARFVALVTAPEQTLPLHRRRN